MQIFGMAISKTILSLRARKKKIIPWCFKNDFGGVFKESFLGRGAKKVHLVTVIDAATHQTGNNMYKATDDG